MSKVKTTYREEGNIKFIFDEGEKGTFVSMYYIPDQYLRRAFYSPIARRWTLETGGGPPGTPNAGKAGYAGMTFSDDVARAWVAKGDMTGVEEYSAWKVRE